MRKGAIDKTRRVVAKGAMKFQIRDAGSFDLNGLPPLIKTTIAFLEKLPNGELISGSRAMGAELKAPRFLVLAGHPALQDYKVKHPTKPQNLWGNKRTIAAFKEQFAS